MDKFPKIYKNKINSIKSKVQDEFYYHADRASDDKKDALLDIDPSLYVKDRRMDIKLTLILCTKMVKISKKKSLDLKKII